MGFAGWDGQKNGQQFRYGQCATMLEMTYCGKFKRDYPLMKRRGCDMELLKVVVEQLKTGKPLDEKYHDHELDGEYKGSRECHIRPDWLLIYWKGKEYIELQRTGTHSDLF